MLRHRLEMERLWVRLPAVSLLGDNPGQVVYTRASMSKQNNVTGQRAVLLGGWEG